MASNRISSLSTEYVHTDVLVTNGGVVIDPTALDVQMAFTVDVDPVESDWQPAFWETVTVNTVPTYYAKSLVGPDGNVTLTKATYFVWVRITSLPEVPVLRAADKLRVF